MSPIAISADAYAPFATGAGSNTQEAQWKAFMKRARPTGVLDGVLNQCNVYGNSTGMFVQVDTGEVWIEGQWGQNQAVKSLPVAPNTTGSTRIDLVVARCRLDTELIEFDVLTGSSSTTLPSLTQTSTIFEIQLGYISVPNGAATITAANVTACRQYGYPYFHCHLSGTPGSPPLFVGGGGAHALWFDIVDEMCSDVGIAIAGSSTQMLPVGAGGSVGTNYVQRLYFNRGGIWDISFGARVQGFNPATNNDFPLFATLNKNGSTAEEFGESLSPFPQTGGTSIGAGNVFYSMTASKSVRVVAGDYVECYLTNQGVSGSQFQASSAGKSIFLSARWLQF